jgi:hypothetical protein
MVQGAEEHAGAEPQPFRLGGDGGKQHERRRRVLRLGREGVVADEPAGEPGVLGVAGELERPPERVRRAGILEAGERETELEGGSRHRSRHFLDRW